MASLFICHATEDKAALVADLASRLKAVGYGVWYDDYELTLGDSLPGKIDAGLAACDFGVVVLSPSFFSKRWPRMELDALFALEGIDKRKRVLPVWHNIEAEEIAGHSPLLLAKIGVPSRKGLEVIVEEIRRAVAQTYDSTPTAPIWSSAKLWHITVSAPTLGITNELSDDAVRVHSRVMLVNRSSRAAVLSFKALFRLPKGDPREYISAPESGDKDRRVRLPAEDSKVQDLSFRFGEVSQFGGMEFFRSTGASLWITDHVSQKQPLSHCLHREG